MFVMFMFMFDDVRLGESNMRLSNNSEVINMTKTDEVQAMMKAIESFSGKVTTCPPGDARGDKPVVTKMATPDRNAGTWIVPPPDPIEEHRQNVVESGWRDRGWSGCSRGMLK
jgi:hypothetical protein